MLLSEYRLSIPKIALNDWQQAVESASGLIQDILKAQTNGVRLLQTIKEPMASTERIAWLNIWAKVFAVLEAVAAAITHCSKLVLLLSQRNSFELMLQIHTVFDPTRNLKKTAPHRSRSNDPEEYALRSIIDRLRAYTAWCLWHDKAYFKELLNPKSMRDIWDFEFFQDIQNAAKTSPFFEQFLEKADMRLDEVAMVEGSRNMRKLYTEKIKKIDEWMVDPHLQKWARIISRTAKKNAIGVPFFSLFDQSDASIPKRLLKEGLRYSYPAYILSSIASHGSSMEEYLQIQGDSIKPVLVGDNDQINILAPEIIFRCQHIFTLLELINQEMLKNPITRGWK